MAKDKKPPLSGMSQLASLKAETPGALPGPAAPFDINKGPDDSPKESTGIDVDELGLEPDAEADVIENEDGSADIYLDSDEGEGGDDSDFYTNLAEVIPPQELDDIGERYMRLIDQDIEARKERDKQQEEGLKRAGLGGPAPGGADFEGASRVTHPILAESYIDFSAAGIKELFPPQGPVRTYIRGTVSDKKLDKAQRKRDYMNYQLTVEIPEYRSELESLMTQLPAGGSQFMKIFYSKDLGRIVADFVPIDDFILPFSAKSYVRSQRKFHRLKKTEFEYQQDVNSGLYVDLAMPPPANMQDDTASQQQTDKIEGKDANELTDDEQYVFYEGSVWDDFTDSLRPEGKKCPYIITIDENTHKVISLYRNWDPVQAEKDEKYVEQEYMVKFGFIPWRGAYDIGLPQLIGDLAASMTGALRALLDSAHIQNSATAMKLKGRPGGETVSISPTQIGEVDAIGQDDIRKVIMPISFNGPSPVLLQLLGYLTTAAKGVVSTSEEKIAEGGNQMPVGTAIALIEQGAKVFSSIFARLHHSQAKCLDIIHRLNRQHMPDKVVFGEDDRDYVDRSDFEGPVDVMPVSDPAIFSETQRFAQLQAVMQLRVSFPGKINDDKLLTRMFQLMKLPDYKELLVQPPAPKPTNPAAENVIMAMAKPASAFPEQDHIAHLQVHLDFLKSPIFGMNPLLAKKIIPAMLEHIEQHVIFYYADLMRLEGREQLGEPIEERAKKDESWQTDRDISEALAKSSDVVLKTISQLVSGAEPVMQAASQLLQKISQPQMPPDPNVMLGMKELEQRAEEHKDDAALAQQRLQKDITKMQHDFQIKEESLQAQVVKLTAQLSTALKKTGMEVAGDNQVAHVNAAVKMQDTIQNNETALEIAAMRGDSSNMTDGGSLSH